MFLLIVYFVCIDNIRLVYTSSIGSNTFIVQYPLLYTPFSLFTVECQGSGYLWWTNSAGNNISFVNSPTQGTMLNFTNFTSEHKGIYTCWSTSGINQSIYISNGKKMVGLYKGLCFADNPAIYTSVSTIYITTKSITNATITIYVSGSNPLPNEDDINWYFNNNLINDSQTVYHFESNNTVLSITGVGDTIIGLYEARVVTMHGSNSIYVNISYPGTITMTLHVT